jgi:hypothetical protein
MQNNDKTAKNNAELIERYVYQVTKRLPQPQRADIEKELLGLIDDMLAGRGDVPSQDDVTAVLRELGRPAELAAKYKGSRQHLIGPHYFDTYLLVLKIVLAAVAFGIVVARSIGFAVEPPHNVFEAFGLFIAAIFSALVQAFAWVTAIFALIEHFAKGAPWKADWSPADLPPVPAHKATIKKSEPIVGIVFGVLFLVLVNVAPQLFSAYIYYDGALNIVPVFDLAVFRQLLPLINVMVCLAILKEILRLAVGRHTIGLAAAMTVINVAAIILFIFIFGPASQIWNAGFMTGLGTTWGASAEAAYIWSIIPKILVGLVIFGNVVDIITTFTRALRHKEVKVSV